jgi:RimJ/RimL family protein N-acetyltransferase
VKRLHARLHPRTVWAATQPANAGSRRVLAACGLQPVRLTWMDTPARARFEWVEVWERVWPPSTT